KVREFASKYISRGKVDIYIAVESFEDSDKEIAVNMELARSYIEALASLRDEFGLRDDVSVSSVARYPDIFTIERKEEDEEQIFEAVKKVLEPAILSFTAMREREGERIQKDLEERIEYMKSIAKKIDERSPETVNEYKARLYDKIKEVLENKDIDDARVLTEVAIFADKVAVNEEMVRLASHFVEFYNICDSNEPAGRKLDFLIQEINREINTTGSKAGDIEIAKMVVELKAETEKLREQIQNIE
ncbi:MAG: YicC family protein, partial [Clostridia bacterium]|nr:YicC family protein [Clostridia bacterium]